MCFSEPFAQYLSLIAIFMKTSVYDESLMLRSERRTRNEFWGARLVRSFNPVVPFRFQCEGIHES